MIDTNKSLSRNKKLALTGAFSALVIVLGITNLGIIPIGPFVSIAILQIPVILIVMLAGLPEGLFVGAVFGIFSLIKAAMAPNGLLDPLFINPLCSVLPRMLIAIVAWLFWKSLSKAPHLPTVISAGVTGFITTIAHTLLVLGSIWLYMEMSSNPKVIDISNQMGNLGFFALIGSVAFNAVLEAIAATIVCAAVYGGMNIAANKKSKLSSED